MLGASASATEGADRPPAPKSNKRRTIYVAESRATDSKEEAPGKRRRQFESDDCKSAVEVAPFQPAAIVPILMRYVATLKKILLKRKAEASKRKDERKTERKAGRETERGAERKAECGADGETGHAAERGAGTLSASAVASPLEPVVLFESASTSSTAMSLDSAPSSLSSAAVSVPPSHSPPALSPLPPPLELPPLELRTLGLRPPSGSGSGSGPGSASPPPGGEHKAPAAKDEETRINMSLIWMDSPTCNRTFEYTYRGHTVTLTSTIILLLQFGSEQHYFTCPTLAYRMLRGTGTGKGLDAVRLRKYVRVSLNDRRIYFNMTDPLSGRGFANNPGYTAEDRDYWCARAHVNYVKPAFAPILADENRKIEELIAQRSFIPAAIPENDGAGLIGYLARLAVFVAQSAAQSAQLATGPAGSPFSAFGAIPRNETRSETLGETRVKLEGDVGGSNNENRDPPSHTEVGNLIESWVSELLAAPTAMPTTASTARTDPVLTHAIRNAPPAPLSLILCTSATFLFYKTHMRHARSASSSKEPAPSAPDAPPSEDDHGLADAMARKILAVRNSKYTEEQLVLRLLERPAARLPRVRVP